MKHFNMNGYDWKVVQVSPNNPLLVDRTGRLTVATTVPSLQTIYISSGLPYAFKARVLAHELSHAAMFSYYLVDDIYSVVPLEERLRAEEMTCNFIADYGWKIYQILDALML